MQSKHTRSYSIEMNSAFLVNVILFATNNLASWPSMLVNFIIKCKYITDTLFIGHADYNSTTLCDFVSATTQSIAIDWKCNCTLSLQMISFTHDPIVETWLEWLLWSNGLNECGVSEEIIITISILKTIWFYHIAILIVSCTIYYHSGCLFYGTSTS